MLINLKTVRGQIILLIISGLLGALVLSGISFSQIEKVFNTTNTVNKKTVPSLITLDKIMNHYGRLRTRIYHHIVSTDVAFMADVDKKILETIQNIRQDFAAYKALGLNEKDKQMLESEEVAFERYLKNVEPILQLSRANKTEDAVKAVTSEEHAKFYEELYQQLTIHMAYNQEQAKLASERAAEEKQSALFLSILTFIGTAICLLLVGGFILRELRKQLGGEPKDVVKITERIAHGDLSSVITLDQGDQNSLLASMATMQDHLKNLISEINTIVSKAAAGDFQYQMDVHHKQGFALEIGQKLNQLNQTLLKQIGGNPEEGARVAAAIAAGNLDIQIQLRSGDQSSMMAAMAKMSHTLKEIIGEIQEMVDAATGGQFHHKIDLTHRQGYARRLGELLNTLSDTTQEALTDIAHLAQTLAKGDLTQNINKHYPGLFGESAQAINHTVNNLRALIRAIVESISLMSSASSEIAAGNQDLSSRTEEQASSLEETASSMEELTSVVRQNSENTHEANQLSQNAASVAMTGGEVVNASVETMREITASSNRIAEIITVIDGIAFQTNILALNAAVEAARAGELGKGFAVVANEVRSLSLRTTESAKQIKDLIQDSTVQVERGTEQANKAGATMREIVEAIRSVSHLIAEISNASNEQRDGIEQVNKAIGQMDEVTQQNAALVEQVAAAAESLENQAQELKQQVSHFKI